MRALTILAIASMLLAACAGGSSKARTATPAATETGVTSTTAVTEAEVTPTPAPTSVATPLSATAQDAVIEQTLRDCMAPALPDDAATAAIRLEACLNQGEGGFHVAGIEGGMPLILVERLDEPGRCRAHAFIVWQTNGWHVQNATVLLPDPVNDRLLGRYVLLTAGPIEPSALARKGVDGDAVLLSVLAGIASCGSGPGTVPMLFALDGDTWRLAWDPRGTVLASLSDPRSDFANASGIDGIHVQGALWNPATDPAGKIFQEAHAGPHRVADQTWSRDGRRYVLAESRILPSAYNTLVNFVYRRSTGDDTGAAELLADTSLLATAKQLGLFQQPLGQQWMTDGGQGCCTIRILSGPQWKTGPPQPVVVTFVQRGADWLISGIVPE